MYHSCSKEAQHELHPLIAKHQTLSYSSVYKESIVATKAAPLSNLTRTNEAEFRHCCFVLMSEKKSL